MKKKKEIKYFLLFFQLRNGQTVCTDNECTDLMPPPASGSFAANGETADNFTWMMFMVIAAVILYLLRPNSLRRRDGDLNKSSRDDVSLKFFYQFCYFCFFLTEKIISSQGISMKKNRTN